MIIDTSLNFDCKEVNCDVCIVGAGTAGLTVASALDNTPLAVALAESGGLQRDAMTQSLDSSQSVDDRINFDCSVARYFGGKSNIWQGRLAALDSIDFQKRPWVTDSGWPIKRTDLEGYYVHASEKLGLKKFFTFHFSEIIDYIKKDNYGFLHGPEFHATVFQWPDNFAEFIDTHKKKVKDSSNIHVYLNANAVEISESESAPYVEKIIFQNNSGTRFSIKARYFILANGGVEIPRLLLCSNKKSARGVGNAHDVVGRYFSSHPRGPHGIINLSQGKRSHSGLFFGDKIEGSTFRLGLRASDELQWEKKLLNHYVLIEKIDPTIYNYFVEFVKQKEHFHKTFYKSEGFKPDHFVPGFFKFASAKILRKIGIDLQIKPRALYLRNYMEQVPNKNSRIFLVNERDSMGMLRCMIDWHINDQEKKSLVEMHKLLAEYFRVKGLGILQSTLEQHLDNWKIWGGSSHFLGATRMHDDPKQGVVAANCKIHGLSNVFIAGPSTFTTSGYANPTLTIVALSLRLADHLKKLILPH